MPWTDARPRTRRWTAAVVAAALAALPAGRAADVGVLFDTEFGGYVPIVGGIVRPDLAAENGRVPETPRKALKRARRSLRANEVEAIPLPERVPFDRDGDARGTSRRWLRQTAIVSDFLVLDPEGRPIEGARIFRYSDPAFYGVNQDSSGARLFGGWRLMPRPFPAAAALAAVAAHDEYWEGLRYAPVVERTPNIDRDFNPWTRRSASPAPPLEYLGETDTAGTFRALSGLFNLEDLRRFPRAVVPDALKLGFVIVADGYLPTTNEKRFGAGGVQENRTLQLPRAPDHGMFASEEWRVALRQVEQIDVGPGSEFSRVADAVAALVDSLDGVRARLPEDAQSDAARKAEGRLWLRLAPHADLPLQAPIARRMVELAPASPARLMRLAMLLVSAAGPPVPLVAGRTPDPPSAPAREAEALLRRALEADPRFLAAYPLLDELLVRRGAGDDERREPVARMLREAPFDPWARARMAVFQFRRGREAEAFDHLRYTYMAIPGIGGDRELALTLSAHYWKVGLPEKAGAYSWLLSGRPPEDPFVAPQPRRPR